MNAQNRLILSHSLFLKLGLWSVLAILVASCGAKTPEAPPDDTPAPPPRQVIPPGTIFPKDSEFTSGGKIGKKTANGYVVDTAIGPTVGQVQVSTSGGYKVMLSVTGTLSQDPK